MAFRIAEVEQAIARLSDKLNQVSKVHAFLFNKKNGTNTHTWLGFNLFLKFSFHTLKSFNYSSTFLIYLSLWKTVFIYN